MYILEKPSTLERCQIWKARWRICRAHTVCDNKDNCDLKLRIATQGSLGNHHTAPSICKGTISTWGPGTKRPTHRQGQQITCLGLAVQITQFILVSSQPSPSDSSFNCHSLRRLDIRESTRDSTVGVSHCPTFSMSFWYRLRVNGDEEELIICANRTGTGPADDSSFVRLWYSSAG